MSGQPARSYLVIAAAIIIAGVLISASLLIMFGKATTTTITETSVSTRTLTMTSNATGTSFTSTSNSSNGLRFSLQQTRYGNGSFTVQVEDFNPLGSALNVTGTNGWGYDVYALNPYLNCAPPVPLGFAITKGYYSISNLSSARPLPLYNTSILASCSLSIFTGQFEFRPTSDTFTQDPGMSYQFTDVTQVTFLVRGYFTGGQGTSSPAKLSPLGPGDYTVIGADEWGQLLLLHFLVA